MPAPKKKKQHYVPRFLLKNFSTDKRTVRGIVLSSGIVFEEGGIAHQCYEDYFYGKDGDLENSFAAEEGRIASLLQDLSQNALESIPVEDLGSIVFFMHYQKYRTFSAAQYVDDLADAHLKAVMKSTLPVTLENGHVMTEEDLDLVRVKTPMPQIASIYSGAGFTPLLLDLEIKFLLRGDLPGFMISDNPVAFYNQFIEHNEDLRQCKGSTGLAVKGLQMFLPVSPNVCIAVYDPTTYCYGSPSRRTCFVSRRDALLINQLQALYAHECIYYDDRCTDEHRDAVIQIRKHHDVHTPQLVAGPLRQRSDGKLSQFIENWATEARIGAKLSCARVINAQSYRGYYSKVPPIRSPELFAYQQDYQRRLQDGSLLANRRAPSGKIETTQSETGSESRT